MPTDLALHIAQNRLCDTHEHLWKEKKWIREGPDALVDLLGNYVRGDLYVARAGDAAMQEAMDPSNPDLEGRFRLIQSAWEAVRHTGYGEEVRIAAREVYGLPGIEPGVWAAAQERLMQYRRPGERLRLLRDVGRIDHVQVDDFTFVCEPDPSGPDFFLYDLSWAEFCVGNVNAKQLHEATGVEVSSLATLQAAMEQIFERYAPLAIAVKSQHAYSRTLAWQPRDRADAERALRSVLQDPKGASEADRLLLGDWCFARGVELAIRHNLPFKLHTGYYVGHSQMRTDRIAAGQLCPLLLAYPKARFVLMHIAYPYYDEVLALAKHFPNVWVDLCWAWAIDPISTTDFVRRFLHAAPANKLLGFGGDTDTPTTALAYSIQMRRRLTKALEAEVAAGELTEVEACRVADRWMFENAYACFDVEGTRAALAKAR